MTTKLLGYLQGNKSAILPGLAHATPDTIICLTEIADRPHIFAKISISQQGTKLVRAPGNR